MGYDILATKPSPVCYDVLIRMWQLTKASERSAIVLFCNILCCLVFASFFVSLSLLLYFSSHSPAPSHHSHLSFRPSCSQRSTKQKLGRELEHHRNLCQQYGDTIRHISLSLELRKAERDELQMNLEVCMLLMSTVSYVCTVKPCILSKTLVFQVCILYTMLNSSILS